MKHSDLKDYTRWEKRLSETAASFPYPATPQIALAIRQQLSGRELVRPINRVRLRWAIALVILALLASLLATPAARAALLEFLQIGAVRIFQTAPTATSEIPATPVPAFASPGIPPVTATSQPTPVDLVSILNLDGETTLAAAREMIDFRLRLPTYPSDLGLPDRVFVQEQGGALLIMAWTDPDQPGEVTMSLHAIGPGAWSIEKIQPQVIQETTVNGVPAVWTVGPYVVKLRNGNLDFRRLISGQVLIWTEGGITYRLETSLPLDEARKIAESLQ
jgi:hypothetical protein